MVYVPAYQSLGDSLKTKRAAKLLDVDPPTLVGHLLYLWWWAMDNAPSGDLSHLDDGEIADAARWKGQPNEFVQALVDARGPSGHGFLERDEEKVLIHDWDEFAGAYILAKRRHAEKMRRLRIKQAEEEAAKSADHVPGTSSRRADHVKGTPSQRAGNNRNVPELTGPNRRGPDHASDVPSANGQQAKSGESLRSAKQTGRLVDRSVTREDPATLLADVDRHLAEREHA